VLVRRAAEDGGEPWMLLHKHDEHAVEGWDPEDHPRSVLSGRTNEEVRADPERLWRSDAPAAEASVSLLPDPLPDEAIDELEALGAQGTWEVFGRRLKVTNLDKVLFPGDPPVTKRELLAYAARIAPVALPYLEGRPLNLHRYPEGADHGGFWHKQRPDHAPEWLGSWVNPEADEGETTTYVVPDEPAALVWAANFGALEWHPWTSRTTSPHEPTYALVDLDPGESTSWEELLVLARLHRTALEHLGVTARAKVTGRRGIQVWVPIVPGVGGEALPHRGQGGARAGQLEVGGQGARWPRPARLHAERHQQDAGRAVLAATGCRRAGVGADRVGRAGRPRPAAGPVDGPQRAGAAGRAR